MPLTIVYTGVDGGAFINSITGPAAGVFVTAASLGLVAQGTANNFKWGVDHWVNGVDNGGSYAGHISFTHLQTVGIDVSLTVNGPVEIIDAGSGLQVIGPTTITGDLLVTIDEVINGSLQVETDARVFGVFVGDTSVSSPVHEYKAATNFVRTVEGTPRCSDDPNSIGGWINQFLGYNRWETTNAFPCITQGMFLIVPSHFQDGQVLSKVRVHVRGGPAHAALPSNLISATVYTVAVGSSAAATSLGSATDPSASTAAYQADHSFDVTLGSPTTIDRIANVYWIEIESEWGAINVIAGAYYLGSKAFYSTVLVASE